MTTTLSASQKTRTNIRDHPIMTKYVCPLRSGLNLILTKMECFTIWEHKATHSLGTILTMHLTKSGLLQVH